MTFYVCRSISSNEQISKFTFSIQKVSSIKNCHESTNVHWPTDSQPFCLLLFIRSRFSLLAVVFFLQIIYVRLQQTVATTKATAVACNVDGKTVSANSAMNVLPHAQTISINVFNNFVIRSLVCSLARSLTRVYLACVVILMTPLIAV